MQETLLSIAIPTYNRAYYLDRCLRSICHQTGTNASFIEIIVSDNASTDNTSEIVQGYIAEGYVIQYIKNEQNLGSDRNIVQCYEKSKGKYVLAFGDDDVFMTGAIDILINLLQQNEFGLVYIEHFAIREIFEDFPVKQADLKVFFFNNKEKFIQRVSYYTTFISGNIINRNALSHLDLYKSVGTNLAQVPIILNAVNTFPVNAVIETRLFAMQTGNTGGYSLFKTFGENYMRILSDIYNTPETRKYKNVIARDMILHFFPSWIYQLKKQHTFEKEQNLNSLMIPLFKGYTSFWIFNYPLINLNNFLSTLYYKAIKGLLVIRNKISPR